MALAGLGFFSLFLTETVRPAEEKSGLTSLLREKRPEWGN